MNTRAEPIIRVEDLTVAYDDFVVFKNVSFEVRPGEVFIILGGSGCGKSTLLRHMISLRKPVKGKVLIDGKDIITAEGRDLVGILRKIGVMYQSGALFGSMNLLENICLVLEEFTNLPRDAMEVIALTKLNVVGLEGAEYKMPAEISGGMKKRAAIARAMALDPKILFCDEPSAGLDPVVASALDDLILKLRDAMRMSIVVVTHELDSAFKIADRITVLDRGDILMCGTVEEIKASPNKRIQNILNRRTEEELLDADEYLHRLTGKEYEPQESPPM